MAEAAPQTLEQTFGVEGERTFGSFSCELETEHALFPGRLFVFESAAGFYAHALGHEIAELVPFVRVDDLSKRNLALFLPHAIDISVAGRTVRVRARGATRAAGRAAPGLSGSAAAPGRGGWTGAARAAVRSGARGAPLRAPCALPALRAQPLSRTLPTAPNAPLTARLPPAPPAARRL